MKILLATSEAVPFAKTGGLADVCGALPLALRRLGHEPIVMMPAYRTIDHCGADIEPAGIEMHIPIGSRTVTGGLLLSQLPGSDVPVYLVAQDEYYRRDGVYGGPGGDYPDNCERFVFFSRAVLETISRLNLDVDVVHCNDWTTGLISAYLRILHGGDPLYDKIASLFSIHNMAYQGRFWHWDMLLTGLDWKYFNWHEMEFHGELNLMKTGLVFSDAISTVSPTYASEIQSAPHGCELEGVLRHRHADVTGIINGVDDDQWNPAADPYLERQYDVETFVDGKATCKAALQRELGLTISPEKPMVGTVGRLAGQKGIDLIVSVMGHWSQYGEVQWVILGSGEERLESQLRALAGRFPDSVAVKIGFDEPLAHRIEAGADIFVMPSRYEACGLNQLYSLKYGTIPVVRETGGLVDTVVDATEENIAAGTATGYRFKELSPAALAEGLSRACHTFSEQSGIWQQLIRTGMSQDWSWEKSAGKYVELYDRVCQSRHAKASK